MGKVGPEAVLHGMHPADRRDANAGDPAARWEVATADQRAQAEARARELEALGARVVTDRDPEYPEGLRDLADAPRVVTWVGAPLPRPGQVIAIVGSRAASPYGLAQAHRLAADLAGLGFTIASGLARGIDGAAHRGALERGGATVAVLPGSLDELTPRHHRSLAGAIATAGTLVSEHVARTPVTRPAFVARNRLIAALAGVTVVVEADRGSGSLHTAAAAKRLGRPVLAVPGDVDRPTARGIVALLRAGVPPCADVSDVLAALGRTGPRRHSSGAGTRLAGSPAAPAGRRGCTIPRDGTRGGAPGGSDDARLLAALDRVPRTVEALASAAALEVSGALAGLLRLEWSGAAARRPGARWVRAEGLR